MKKTNKAGSKTREKILKFMIDYITKYGYCPSIREIGKGVNLSSTNTIHAQLNKMLELGMIESDMGIGCARAFRIPGYKFVKIEEIRKENKKEPLIDLWKK